MVILVAWISFKLIIICTLSMTYVKYVLYINGGLQATCIMED